MRCELDIPLPFDLVWDRLRDLNAVAACLPGATVERATAEHVHGRITARFRTTSVTYRGAVGVAETGPGTVLITANAAQVRGTGSVDGTVRVRARAEGGSTTHVEVVGRAVVSGRAAELPEDVVHQTVHRLVEAAAERFTTAASSDVPTTEPTAAAVVADTPTQRSAARLEATEPANPTKANETGTLAGAAVPQPAPESTPVPPAPSTAWLPVPVARASTEIVPVARRIRPRGRRALWLAAAVATVVVVGAARGAGRSLDGPAFTLPRRRQ